MSAKFEALRGFLILTLGVSVETLASTSIVLHSEAVPATLTMTLSAAARCLWVAGCETPDYAAKIYLGWKIPGIFGAQMMHLTWAGSLARTVTFVASSPTSLERAFTSDRSANPPLPGLISHESKR